MSLENELRHQAFHDPLTGLANRALFINRVEHALASAKRHNSSMAVLYCDMHGFNRVNDSLGYSAGEAALLVVAARLRACVRGEDTVARLGGQEFGVLLDRLSSYSDATLAMERIMATLRQPIPLTGAQGIARRARAGEREMAEENRAIRSRRGRPLSRGSPARRSWIGRP